MQLIAAHKAEQEYLTGSLTRIELPRYHISYQSAHEQLARFCICYLTQYLKHVHRSANDNGLPHIMRIIEGRSQWSNSSENTPSVFSMSLELLDYVFIDGFNHLAYLDSANRVVLNDLTALGLDIQRYPEAWEVIYQMSRQHKPQIPWPSQKHDFMLYILIAFSSPSLFHAFLRRSHAVLKPKYQTNPLVYAAHFGKAKHAEMLLSRRAQVNERGLIVNATRLSLPLEIAVKRRQDAMVDLLLFAGSMVPKQLFTLSTYYHKYPAHIIRRLMETDQFVEWAVEPGNKLPSPLRILAQQPPLAHEADIIFIIRRLLQVGVDPTEKDSAGRTALHFSILGGYKAITMCLLLISRSLPPDFISTLSRTPSSEQIPMLRSIIEAGFDVDAHVPDSDTTLHLAITSFQNNCLEVVRILVGAGCNPFARNGAGKTPLHIALEKRDSSVADSLLSQETPPSDALLALVETRYPTTWKLKTLRTLVNAGVNVHDIIQYEDASLHRARAWHDPSSGRNTRGDAPPGLLTDRNSPLFADFILATGRSPPPDTLFSVLRSDLPPAWKALTIFLLVGNGGDVQVISADGNTLLHAVVLSLDESWGLDIAKLLVDAGCDPFQYTTKCKTSETPLHLAIAKGYLSTVRHFLSIAMPPSLPADILAYALLGGPGGTIHTDYKSKNTYPILRLLINRGADTRIRAADGGTLLHMAIKSVPPHPTVSDSEFDLPETLYRHSKEGEDLLNIFKLLVDSGCNPSLCDADGRPPIYFPIITGHDHLIRYLLPRTVPLPRKCLEDAIDLAPLHAKLELLDFFDQCLSEEWKLPESGKLKFKGRLLWRLR